MQFGKLRDIASSELETMLAWRNSPKVRANMYTRHEISLEEHLAWWGRVQRRDDCRYFMYELEGKAQGVVSFNAIDRVNKNAFWAFYASPAAPPGTGSRMEILALDYAFEELKLHKLSAEVLAFNQSVLNLHKKFGFVVEGIFRDHHRVDENYVDVYRISMLRHEWPANRERVLSRLQSRSKE